jgi:hypothetical protein
MTSSATVEPQTAPAYDAVLRARARLDAWIEAQQFRGWDPHDALNSPIVRALTFGNRYLGIVWLQLVKRSPLNLRPLLRVPKGYNPKGMGLFLASYLRKGDAGRARFFARWLVDNASKGFHGPCWGYNFDWPNRGFFAAKGTPTIVNTAFNGFAFLDAARMMPRLAADIDPLAVARGACEFLLRDLNIVRESDELCFSYTPLDRRFIHNANVLGAQLLAEVGAQTGESELARTALAAARFTARRQKEDGSWPYGIGGNDGWVDNFHTAYVLVALRRIARALATSELDVAVGRGYEYWMTRMFDSDGLPMHYAGRLHPIDIHAVAEAILALLEFRDHDPNAEERAWALAEWAIDYMQDERGFFHYQIARRHRVRIPYIRWSQAWMQRALTELLYQSRPPVPH